MNSLHVISKQPTLRASCLGSYQHLSSTWPEFDPDTAYVVCISVSLGFRQKPSDTALFSVTALTTFKCIVRVSVTKGELVCFVVTVHWWRHRTNYDVTEAYRALLNDRNRSFEQWVSTRGPERNPQTLRNDDESKHQSTIYTGDFGAIFTTYGIIFVIWLFMSQVKSLGFWTKGRAFGPRTSLDRWRQLAWQVKSYKYG